ncbi:flavin-containing monooxygenase [Gordonia humi]|uniref:Cation diffusion facilitator CzcD-associated flavoprotein CzcO n=1 Tax=Gordonia humi TaxID=686429 RepID=A0A840F0E2_9ACTN|nr:NAD(P)/FAD-dependent oxidoreductase [Gordonia humi]MBB4137342.1 cation diffusion facilitator CzcD-associated flavoprotein CzcO [Gordonia humi]
MSEPTASSIAVIGTGFGGIGMAAQLKAAGFDDFVIFEKADGVGGVWRDNEYPGAECDVPSHLYSFSFALKPDWSRRFAGQQEILDYLNECADRFDLRGSIRFGTEVVDAAFDETAGEWVLHLAGGDTHRARILIAATGQLSRPAYPKIPGIDEFAGTMFHSSTWDHDYAFEGKDVAVIGTGASAIQFVPHIAARADRLELFQRHAPHVIAKPDYPYRARTIAAFRRFPALLRASRLATYAWLEPRGFGFNGSRLGELLIRLFEKRYLRGLRKQITDPALLAKVTPTDPMGCKRILMSNDYYPALVGDHVDVVTDGIAKIVPEGIVTVDGRTHEVDAIVLGTGFAATEFLAPMTVTGLGGADLGEVWRDGAHAYLGLAVPGFPNFFMLYGPNTNLSHNSIVYMLESQFSYVVDAVADLADSGADWLTVRRDVEDAYNDDIQAQLATTVWATGCDGWYTTESGRNTQNWPGFTFKYRAATREFDPSAYAAPGATQA